MKKFTLIYLLLIISLFANAQKEANVWCFGFNAGLDFNSGSPIPLNDVQISTQEGCASIADKTTGQLLFYTDGISVWDSSNNLMPNGEFDMLGNWSATESAVCVPLPGSSTQYYIFTVDAQAGNPAVSFTGYGGVAYSIVDMTMNGGLGDISVLNTPLLTPTPEKIAAVRHCNGGDIWIVIHQWDTNAFYAYLLTSAGLQPPVITNIGIVHQDVGSGFAFEAIGYMKFSPNGQKLALACFNDLNLVQIFDFDNSTGIVSNPVTDTNFPMLSAQDGPYGVSFSPDNSKLYVGAGAPDSGEYSHIYQYNMLAGDSSAILASRTAVLTDSLDLMGGLQIGPDGKMYIAKESLFGTSSYLDVINYPDSLGAACNYVSDGVYLGSVGQSAFGLPDIIQSYLSNPITASLTYTDCSGSHTLNFTDNQLNGAINTSWNFGDTASGTSDTSSIRNPSHTFSSSGTYNVTVYFSTACQVDSFIQAVTPQGGVSASVGPDTSVCAGNAVPLHAMGGSNYVWTPSTFLDNPNIANPVATPSVTTTYTVNVSSGSCNDTATVVVNVTPLHAAVQPPDTTICAGNAVHLNAEGGTTYVWTPSTYLDDANIANPVATPSVTTTYTVNVSSGTCNATAIVVVNVAHSLSLTAGPDTSVCSGDPVQLQASGGSTYKWSPSTGLTDTTSATPTAYPTAATTYTVTVTSAGCSGTAMVTINVHQSPPTPTILQSGDILFCTTDPSYSSFQWYDSTALVPGATDTSFIATHSGNYNLTVTNKNGCSIAVGINVILNGIQEYVAEDAISIAPNPVKNQFTIHDSRFTIKFIGIYNILGQICQQSEITNPKSEIIVDMSKFESGIYFVSVKDEYNRWVGKVVKE